ncbi:hypothetical protein BKA62DRAFT_190878 [Auriculariales sp. MPI-PUGE-AT-0066]|nr:hypothetical protein BKA62DRAFT_190878 [Auriculariales sp. MPI-PUGE-AT-0066]
MAAALTTVQTADELRAAALRTLKIKRKLPEIQTTVSAVQPGLLSEGVVTLNYDEDPAEESTASPGAAREDSVPPSVAPGTVTSDDGEREEGEISDGEVDPADANGDTKMAVDKPRVLTIADIEKSLLVLPNQGPRPYQAAVNPAHEQGLRPKLSISPGELHEFKLHLLDVLGFGVPPEYLIEYGVSSETLAYALHELNFRQPINLKISEGNAELYPASLNERVSFTKRAVPSTPTTASQHQPSFHRQGRVSMTSNLRRSASCKHAWPC